MTGPYEPDVLWVPGLGLWALLAALVVQLNGAVEPAAVAMPPATSPSPSNALSLVTDVEPGKRLHLDGQVIDEVGHPVPGARLHVYQTDNQGRYTLQRPMDEPHARLSGWILCDAKGHFDLSTIRPGGYPKALRLGGRDRKIPPHIHIDVSATGYTSHKFQAVFADDPLLADPYWQEWVRRLGQPVLSVQDVGSYQSANITLSLQHDRLSLRGQTSGQEAGSPNPSLQRTLPGRSPDIAAELRRREAHHERIE